MISLYRQRHHGLVLVSLGLLLNVGDSWWCTDAFAPPIARQQPVILQQQSSHIMLAASSSDSNDAILTRISEEDEGVPIPFVDKNANSFIECYADSIATVDGEEYTIGVPCDYCVALCYMDSDNNLVPVELTDKLMDDIFPIAENVIMEEFGEELALQRTPQTLTLVGELEDDDEDDEDDDDEDDDDDDDDDPYDGEEEVELLLSFDHRDREYNLVRLMDPVLLVGKIDPERPDRRILLTPEESDKIMPTLESAFLKYHEDGNSMLP
ncbi:DUF3727 domain containing protein [Nitzschia inconspicua]|uniref:DUF3727 domain containing protein n=1 Tax=Nitzschia inconspicua TaxID=303405 RepID=A0A9K3M123_9STRA|nr:DUF3727 domain containing protein [Nitzschia inconspicua]